MSNRALELAAERMASRDRAMPTAPGLNAGRLTGEMSTGHHRLSAKASHQPHVATSARRFGVKPTSGAISDLYTPKSLRGQDDGSDYFAEYREGGGMFPIPTAKTRKQDQLRRLCVAFIAGEDMSAEVIEGMRDFIAKIVATDPEHGNAWRQAMTIHGLYH